MKNEKQINIKMKNLLLIIILSMVSSQLNAQIDKGLVAYWPLDGTPNDLNNQYNGTFVGDITASGDRFGNTGCAVQIGKSNSYFQYYKANTANEFFFWNKDCTFSFWFMPDNVLRSTGAHLARHTYNFSNPYFNNFIIDLEENDTLNMCQKIATNFSLSKIWNHLVITYDFDSAIFSAKTNIYWNNKLIGTKWSCYGGESYDAFLRFGESVGTKLDDIRYYNRALSASEVAELYSLPSSCTVTGIENEQDISNKILLKILTPLGQEIKQEQAIEGLFIYLYTDGTIKKVLNRN